MLSESVENPRRARDGKLSRVARVTARLNLEHGSHVDATERARASSLRPTYEGNEPCAECWVTSMKRQTKIVVAFFVRPSVYTRVVVRARGRACARRHRSRSRVAPGADGVLSVAALIVFASKRRYDIYRPPLVVRSIRRKPRRMLRIARGNRKAGKRSVCVQRRHRNVKQ